MNCALMKALVVMVLQLALASAVGAAVVPDAPHDLGNGYRCSDCHTNHNTLGSTGYNNVCLNCHNAADPKGGRKPFSQADMANPFGSFTAPRPAVVFQSSHNWASPDTNRAAGAEPPVQAAMTSNALRDRTGGRLACVRCHNQHSQENPPFLRLPNDRDQLCLDCHRSRDRRDHTSGTHPVNFGYTSASSKARSNPAEYFPLPVNANPANPTSALPLKGGLVLCSSCHGVHFSDSNSATFDSFSSTASQTPSSGFLLRTDLRGASADAVNICSSCHRGKTAHNFRGQNVQCADCHGAHVDPGDGSTPNVWLVNRFMNFSSALGSARNRPVLFQSVSVKNYRDADGTGVCQACHKIPMTAGYQTFHDVADNSSCNQCHNHNNPLGAFAVNPDAACNTCHGHPPAANVAGAGGYAAGYQNAPSFTDESQSGHPTHASAPYQKDCQNCHSGNNHLDGRFQDVFQVTAGTVAATGGLTPAYDSTAQTCSNVYCHSNGNPRGGTFVLRGTPSWSKAKGGGKGAIVGQPDECASCHSAAGETSPGWSPAHTRHVNGYAANPNFSCERCHAATASGNSALIDTLTARSLHTNGVKDVVFGGFAASGRWEESGAACSNLYCHSDVQGAAGLGAPTAFTQNLTWNAGAMSCGACHPAMAKLNNVSSATGSHKTHVQRYPFSCAYCHGPGYSENGVAVASHVDGVIQIAFTGTPVTNGSPAAYYQGSNPPGGGYAACSNVYCHSTVQGAGGTGSATAFASPTWGDNALPCGSCHANMATSAAATGSHLQHAQTSQIACSVCHNGAGKDPNPPFTPTILHANGVIDIAFSGSGAGTAYSTGSHAPGRGYGTCSGSSCHGGGAPAWGANTARPDCEKCHGSAGTNPFYTTAGVSAASDPKAGAHTAHLFSASAGAGHLISGNVSCAECHSVPASLTAPGHFGTGPAPVPLGGALARTGGLAPSYDPATRSCANTYCHGASAVTVGGSKTVPVWNVPLFTGVAGNDCALCHGYPPPSPIHAGKTPSACQGCHPHVNGSGTGFVDPTKHVNGVIEVHGAHEIPYYSHNTATSFVGCSGCHNASAPGAYPNPVAGDPPNCRGCHVAADPTVASNNCVSCHAKPPNGATPPNLAGSHARHAGVAAAPGNCALCHNGAGSGSGANHGTSNRGVVPSVVNVSFSTFSAAQTGSNAAYNAQTQSCSNTYCHSSVQGANGTGAASPLTTPAWGSTLSCGGCHADMAASAAATGSHAAHAQGSGTAFACSVCHGSGYTATSAAYPSHVNRRIDLSFAGNAAGTIYSKGSSIVPGSAGYGSCSSNNCHGAMNPVWGNNTGKGRCQKCHGYRSPGWNALNGASAASDAKAGTHFNHISSAGAVKFSRALSCAECHAGSIALAGDNVNAAGHYDSAGPAEVSFAALAKTGNLAPTYNAGQCSNTYCHGNTLDKPATAVLAPVWNQPFLTGVAANDCAKCHGYPPATAVHTGVAPSACHNCHPHVNASGTGFSDPSRHLDGVIQATGAHSFPFPGALHAAAANAVAPFSNCNGCHNTTTPGGSYPVPAGTPPFCSGCHLNATNFTGPTPGCWDCHGTGATSGRPAGNVFPNFSGSHSRHAGVTGAPDNCAICHSGSGSGSPAHGSSNRSAATPASVEITFNAAQAGAGAAWNPAAQSCSGSYCHSSVQGVTGTGAGIPLTTPAWGNRLSCGGCHSDMATSASATGSHAAHAQGSGTVFACSVCHGSGYTASSAVYPSHVNNRIDLSFSANAAGTAYSKGSSIVPGSAAFGSCSNNNCHGAMNAVWGNNSAKQRCLKCHGYRSEGWNALNGATATSDAKAGTHFNHISSAGAVKYSRTFSCAECHLSSIALPGDSVNAAGHYDSAGPAEVSFSVLARTGALTPTYNTGQCANTYCHGNTLDKPATAVLAPTWNQPFLTGVAANDCAKCHGYPPAGAVHSGVAPSACRNCHPHVNASGTGFSDPSQHIDGLIQASGAHPFPYPGASHRSAANAKAPYSNCSGCHDTTTPGGPYPVAAGTAPFCSACHLATANFNGAAPGCWDCHGASATDGRPNGTSFPNNDLNHSAHAAVAASCSVCHLNAGTGSASHGASNRAAASVATVEVAFSATPAGPAVWAPATRTCSATLCHGQGAPTWGASSAAPVNGFPYSTLQCAKCHSGNLAGDVTAANPFYSTAIPKVTANTDAKVGAHTSHLTATDSLTSALVCADCHGAVTLTSAGHLNGSSNFSFNALAATGGLTPSYNATTGVCSNVYCHGAAMPGGDSSGSNRAPTWKSPFLPAALSAAACSTCHGFPPSTGSGHPGGITIPAGFPNTVGLGTTCSCHPNINPTGNSYANIFVNKALHINGTVEASGAHAFPFPGASHLSAAGSAPWPSCVTSGCHVNSAGGSYPVAAGTPPNCTGCHLQGLKAPSGTSACYDCHGPSATDGRPNGTSFPNNDLNHTAHAGIASSCSVCHLNAGAGSASHGSSNRSAASLATVEVAFSATPAGPGVWSPAAKTCSSTLCHGLGAPTWGATATAPVSGFPYSTVQCAKCHSGNLAGDVTAAKPFYSTAIPKATANTDAKVGAHTSHLTSTDSLTSALTCADCHGAVTLTGAGHLNGSTNFSFNALARSGGLTPSYNAISGVCSNVYCHGAAMPGGDATGSNRTPSWKTPFLPATLSTAACSSCHGFPPAAASGHPTGITIPAGFPATASLGTTCSCHPNVNPSGNSYANIFVNKALHIDGVLQVSVTATHPVPYYNHQSAGTGASCTGCHAIGTASSVYPAPVAGNAPDCRGCHRKAAPGTATGAAATFGACGSCHGSLTATTAANEGRPNGTVFPDRVGRHQGSGDSAHLRAACTKCHILTNSGTGATVNHGRGNRDANPDIVGPGFVTGITITGAGKGVSPTATCNHSIINANNGGGCSGGPSSATW